MPEQIDIALTQATSLLAAYGLDVLGAIGILVVGWIAAGWISSSLGKALSRMSRVDQTLRSFFVSTTKYAVLTFTVIAVLGQFGIQTTSILAALGAVGLAIGLALQGTLANVAAGVMLLIFRPFKVGDYVDAGGHAGTVKSLTLFTTELATPDNVQIIVPNGKIWGGSVTNFSHHQTRRVDIAVGVSYDDNIDTAFDAIAAVIQADSRCMAEPEPLIATTNLGDNSVDLVVRVWTESANYWPLKFALTKAIKEKLDAVGITIPYPQRTVHVVSSGGDAAKAAPLVALDA